MIEKEFEEYKKLFNTNNEQINFDSVLNRKTLEEELNLFEKSTVEQQNYVSDMTLERWSFSVDGKDIGDNFENVTAYGLGILNEYLFKIVPGLGVKTVLDGGAGGGMNTKILSTRMDKSTKFYCLENYKKHCEHIKQNLEDRFDINKPHVKVDNFEIINSSLHKIPLTDNSVDLTFTHAVVSHIPFLPAILAIKEISRISSKYVLHIEQKNLNINIVVPGYTKHECNKKCTINYPKIYSELGFEKISYSEVPLHSGQYMCVYLGKKII